MSARGEFAYAQVRLQSRLASSPTREALQTLYAARDLGALLAAVRATAYRRFATRLAPGLEPHELERHLRDEWIALVDEVAQWQPPPWRATVQWLRWLPSLPLLQKLARGGRPPAWARDDPILGRIVATDPAARADALEATPLRTLRVAFEARPHDVIAAWAAQWRHLWPHDRVAIEALEGIARDIGTCAGALRAPAVLSSRASVDALRQRLLRRFRRHPLSPAAAVAFLALEGLALLELRGNVLRRAVVEPGAA